MGADVAATDLIISEYIEGSSNNKAIEIYNGTGAPISLAGYQISVYFNGAFAPTLNIALGNVMLAPGEVYVVAHASSSEAILAQADQSSGAGWYNGDDAVALRRTDGMIVDVVGQIGLDPGTQWGSGLTSTADNTLRRKLSVENGDTSGSDSFDPAAQWDGFETDTFGGLGSHGTTPPQAFSISALSASKVEGNIGATSFTFTVTRPTSGSVENVAWSLVGSGADGAESDDFVNGLTSGLVTFAAGETSKTLTIQVAGDFVQEGDETFTVTLNAGTSPTAVGTIRNDDLPVTQIAEIQGAAHVSTKLGQTVATIGIVTAVTSNGFWLQDPTPDADAATSEAIFIFTGSAPSAAVVAGAEFRVTGVVTEFKSSAGSAALPLTEIVIGTTGFYAATGATGTIAPTLIGVGGLLPPTANYGDDNNVFDPATEGLDFWESLEGMLVTLNNAVASDPSTSQTFSSGATDSEVFAILEGASDGPFTSNGSVLALPDDFNPERIAIQEDARVFNSDFNANAGDRLGDVTGVLTYTTGGHYEVIATQQIQVTAGPAVREVSTSLVAAEDQLTIASYNAENLAATSSADKFAAIAQQIVLGLQTPDIIALQEIQDDNGALGFGVTGSNATLNALVDAIVAAGGPLYSYAYVTPAYNTDGGEPNGNIRQAFLYNADRVQLAAGAVGDFDDAVEVSGAPGTPELSLAVGRIDPTNAAFDGDIIPSYSDSRKPLVAEFIFNGESVFVINNHFNSKGGDDPLFGANQPPVEVTQAQRIAQAQVVADFVDQILAIDPDANVAVVGDLNDFGFSAPLAVLEDAGLSNLADLLPEEDRFDYIFQGNAQELDHILVSGNLGEEARFDILHINSEFWDQTSDHDPLIASLNIAKGQTIVGANGDGHIVGGAGDDWIDGGNGADWIDGANGKDELHGGRGDDLLFGGNGADKLFGEQGSDRLEGGVGNDLLVGGQGDDWLVGGDGADLFVFAKSGGSDTIADFETGVDSLLFGEGQGPGLSVSGDYNADGTADLFLSLSGGGSVILLGVGSYAELGLN